MEYNCQTCGACCCEYDVLLDGADLDRFEKDPHLLSLTVLHQGRTGPALPFMRRRGPTDRCVALAGPLTNCRCTIYPDRPQLCRDFTAGSPECLEARRKIGYAP